MKIRLWMAAVVCCLVTVVFPARGDTIFDNYGPGNRLGNGQLPVSSLFYHAFAFTPTGSSFTLTNIDLALVHYAGFGPNTGVVQLRGDSAGGAGVILEQWDLTTLPEVDNNTLFSAPPVSLTSVLHPALSEGATYWLAAGASDPASNDSWLTPPDISLLLPRSDSTNGGVTFSPGSLQVPSAFRISGSPIGSGTVPEPGSVAMLVGLGVVGTGFAFSRLLRRRT